ncbi:fatty acid desaturase [Mycobacterium kubicae]|uniref:Fatty acid desaturase n=1 Tax=Mycobacterium kubicae TaxID=120959 RepID=A0AAX1JGV2_9MYCO|nr:fatty acid desaturase [Mycobacterium kubicae]MCV7097169.1 fatty acid desaturase [Mycobacterium kubicae]OBF18035.1 fatty acid desaturase [Mycobacterium kubicae]ORW03117.1 fatty acid desaturase [Mycobacterium kubicae]QNI11569.1 fatty acid desaturase [Mycobacterium kubicae]QPI39790.1 fatty acid desaturase [Mycobacterium kubicae]
MAISDIAQYAHLSPADIEALGADLDEIRRDIETSRGQRDAAYIHRTIAFQRALEVGSRLLLGVSPSWVGWAVGTVTLALAKSVENMEIGHNVGHGQWDWMNDPEIHSNTWEWDMAGVSSQWRYAHNYRHHVFTNVLEMDDDLGFGFMRVTRDQPWQPRHLLQPIRNVLLAITFEWGIALHDLRAVQTQASTTPRTTHLRNALLRKTARQAVKDYLVFPALSGRRWRRTLIANTTANVLRNLWAYMVIFCGHFPDGAEKFTAAVVEDESKAEWYLRQMLGTANFDAGPALAFWSGNLCYQIEHHLFPDLPSNRYAEIAERVRALCNDYDLPYTSGSLVRQFWLTMRTLHKLALPDRVLSATPNDAPETASERKFFDTALAPAPVAADGSSRRSGLRTALRNRATKAPERTKRARKMSISAA